jgi:hypothetical protein
MTARGGFWRADNASVEYYQCLQPGDCLSGDSCAANRVGPLCAVCRDGYREDTGARTCSICPKRDNAVGGTIGFTVR